MQRHITNVILFTLVIMALLLSDSVGASTIYEDAKAQCHDRVDKEVCLAYFNEMLGNNTTPREFFEASTARKEERYARLRKLEPYSRLFREEIDYAARKIDSAKTKRLRSTEIKSRQQLKESKEAAAIVLQQYNIDIAACGECDLSESKRIYVMHLTNAVTSGITAMIAAVQRSPYITEKDATAFGSRLNQKLADARVLRARLAAQLGDKEITGFRNLMASTKNLNIEIALLQAHGTLYSIALRLALMHTKWERKAAHVFVTIPDNAEEISYHLELYSDSLDKAFAELVSAQNLLQAFNPSGTKKILGYLYRAHQQLLAAANEQSQLVHILQNNDIEFSTPYDLIEEWVDDGVHGIRENIENDIHEEIIPVRLYPEKGEASIMISAQRHVFSTIEENELIAMVAKEMNLSEQKVKHLLRFEIGGK